MVPWLTVQIGCLSCPYGCVGPMAIDWGKILEIAEIPESPGRGQAIIEAIEATAKRKQCKGKGKKR